MLIFEGFNLNQFIYFRKTLHHTCDNYRIGNQFRLKYNFEMRKLIQTYKRNQKYFVCIAILTSLSVFSAWSYNIHMHIHGLSNVNIMLAEFYGNTYYVIDTIRLDAEGKGQFKTNTDVSPGIYYIVLPNKNSIEFLLSSSEELKFQTNIQQPFYNLQVQGSEESSTYIHYQQFLAKQFVLLEKLTAEMKDSEKDLNAVYRKMKEISAIQKNIEERKAEIIQNYPDWIFSEYLKMTIDPMKHSSVSSTSFQEKYEMYFREYDFSAVHVVRTPFFPRGINHFIKRYATDNQKIRQMVRFILDSKMPQQVKGIMFEIMHEHFQSMDQQITGEQYLVSMSGELIKNEYPKIGFNPSMIMSLQKTFPGNAIPAEILNQISTNGLSVLGFWNPNCAACKSDVKRIHAIDIPVHVAMLSPFKSGEATKSQHFNTIELNADNQTLLNFPVNHTPVYFLVNDKGIILQKTYHLNDISID